MRSYHDVFNVVGLSLHAYTSDVTKTCMRRCSAVAGTADAYLTSARLIVPTWLRHLDSFERPRSLTIHRSNQRSVHTHQFFPRARRSPVSLVYFSGHVIPLIRTGLSLRRAAVEFSFLWRRPPRDELQDIVVYGRAYSFLRGFLLFFAPRRMFSLLPYWMLLLLFVSLPSSFEQHAAGDEAMHILNHGRRQGRGDARTRWAGFCVL